jgi:mRNA interferase MazF
MILAMPITTSPRYEHDNHFLPILINGQYGTGVKGYIALWQLQNFDFESRNGQIVNRITDKMYEQLMGYVKDMLDLYRQSESV